MPLNTLRLNHQKSSHPNDRIVFIKPLPRIPTDQASHDLADTFLRAIAAQCLPIMKNHYLSVTTLEEHEPNREFIGRNFNNGEIIQLVLRSLDGSRWLSFNTVQMVMMHELAHNTHMNHGRDFWKTRNIYAEELKDLWRRRYTGEGFWGSGKTLSDLGQAMGRNVVQSQELEGLSLCGGTFRSRRRKRKAGGASGQDLTWKEKRDRRIDKKFGKNGVSLGEDEDHRLRLEISKSGPIGGKPRVAQSKRGRELRAAAALARYGTNKREVQMLDDLEEKNHVKNEPDGDEADEYEDVDSGMDDARDTNGDRLLDRNGHGMLKVCGDEDVDSIHVKQEMDELEGLDQYWQLMQDASEGDTIPAPVKQESLRVEEIAKSTQNGTQKIKTRSGRRSKIVESHTANNTARSDDTNLETNPCDTAIKSRNHRGQPEDNTEEDTEPSLPKQSSTQVQFAKLEPSCPICSLACDLDSPTLTCLACSHVLFPSRDPRSWSCQSPHCLSNENGREYVNAGDAGVCGLCGVKKGEKC